MSCSFKAGRADIVDKVIMEGLKFLRWDEGNSEDGSRSKFTLLEKELKEGRKRNFYMNLDKGSVFTQIYNKTFYTRKSKRCHVKSVKVTRVFIGEDGETVRRGIEEGRISGEAWVKVEEVYQSALKRLGLMEVPCPGWLLKNFKTCTIIKTPFENADIIKKFAIMSLGKAAKYLQDSLKLKELGHSLRSSREIITQGVIRYKDKEWQYGYFSAREPKKKGKKRKAKSQQTVDEPRHPRYYCWLTTIRKRERLAILYALTHKPWVEVDITNAIPQGLCRLANCPESLARMKDNSFLSKDEDEREEQKLILSPDTFRLVSKRVHGWREKNAAKRLRMFFTEFPEEGERYITTAKSMKNVHSLFDIENIMRRFLLTHPYALHIHDGTFFPCDRVGDIMELIEELNEEEIYFKVSLHINTTTQDITKNYQTVLRELNAS